MEIEKRTKNYKDGSYIEIYHKKGDQDYWHREDGPAIIYYNKDGSIKYESYYINDRRLSKEDWEDQYGWKSKLKGTPMGEIFLTQN